MNETIKIILISIIAYFVVDLIVSKISNTSDSFFVVLYKRIIRNKQTESNNQLSLRNKLLIQFNTIKYHHKCGGTVVYREAVNENFDQAGYCLRCEEFPISEEDIAFESKKDYIEFEEGKNTWIILSKNEYETRYGELTNDK